MKKRGKSIISILVIILLIVAELLPSPVSAAALPVIKEVTESHTLLLTTPNFQLPNTRVKPAQLRNVRYIYQKDVKRVDLSKYFNRDGSIKPPVGINIAPGNILVDESMKASLYVLGKNPDGTLIARQPTLNEVFENFEIPEQTVRYNTSNIIDLQPAIHNARIGKANPANMGTVTVKFIPPIDATSNNPPQQKLASISSDKEKEEVDKALAGGWRHSFDKAVLNAYLADGTKLSVKLSGEIALNMSFDTKYTAFSGYRFGINGAEMIKLKAALDVKINKEIYIPIVGVDIPFAIGRVRAGLFVVVGVNGDITLVVSGEEGMSFSAGIKGGTCFAIPTSFNTYGERHTYFAAECDPNGQITAYTYLTPTVSLEALGINVIKAELRLGFKAHAIKKDTLLDYGMNAVAQFYVGVLGVGTNIFNVDIPLFSRQKEAAPGGFFFYGDLCAYRDDTVMAVFRAKAAGEELPEDMDPFADKLPYAGPIQIYYYRGDTTKPYKIINASIASEAKGILNYNFKMVSGIDVVKNDSIRIVIPNNSEAISKNIFSTMPFKGIGLEKADFFNELAFGQVQPVSGVRDMPGWANTVTKTELGMQVIYCKNKNAQIKFVDPTNKVKTVTKTATTDSQGKFIIQNDGKKSIINSFDIRPYRKAIPYINIDGFDIEGAPIDTTAGIYFVMGTDYRTDFIGKTLIKNSDGTLKEVTVNTLDEIIDAEQIVSEEHTSGDHFIAVNKYGTKRINSKIDYNTNAYYVENMDFISNMAKIMASEGATVDVRDYIMGSKKQLIYNEHAALELNEKNNSQIELFKGPAADESDIAIDLGQTLSSSHAYHRMLIKDGDYKVDLGRNRAPSAPTAPIKRRVSGITIDVFKENFEDTSNPLQQKGVDATVTLNMGGGGLENGLASSIIYIDTNATLDIEGYKLIAIQSDPWIIKGERHTTGTTPEQKLKDEIARFMEEGPIYFKRFVINPLSYENNLKKNWSPAANTIKHELVIDYQKGSMIIDGIKVDNVAKGSMVNGKLYFPAAPFAKMMGGTSSFDAKARKLTLNAGGRNIVLNTASKTAVINGKTISIPSGSSGEDNNIEISAETISSLFGASVKIDTKTQSVKVNFTGN
ncbi:MAG: hypothetical protein K0R09_93 [Clostridiales bacterium]|nr:hypothetical protein [Clostridiales bacterium]